MRRIDEAYLSCFDIVQGEKPGVREVFIERSMGANGIHIMPVCQAIERSLPVEIKEITEDYHD